MRLFRNISIRNKITVITLVTCVIALLSLLISFTILEFSISRTALVEQVATLAEVLGTNSTAALTFNDSKSAEATLSALNAESEIVSAAIYTRDGRLFAFYLHPQISRGDLVPAVGPNVALPGRQGMALDRASRTNYSFKANYLDLSQKIVLEGEVIGSIYLKSTMANLYRRLGWYAILALVAIFPSLLIAYLLSSRLQRIISRPIVDLAQTMKMVSREKNYSVQVEKFSEDELGGLIDGFNEMLAQIQKRDHALERHREELEREVLRRTAELSQSNRELAETIEELNQATDFLAQNERRLAYAQQVAGLGYWEWRIGPDKLVCSGEVSRLFGLEPEEIDMNRQAFLALIQSNDKALVEDAMAASLSTGQPFQIDSHIVTAAGSQCIVNIHGEVTCNEVGEPVKMTGTIQDITERKKAERSLSESEEKYRALMDNAGEGILLADLDGNHLEANKKMVDLLGYPLEELLNLHSMQLVHPEYQDKFQQSFKDLLASGSGALNNALILRNDGKPVPVDISTTLVRYAGKTLIQGIFRDVSERRKMEDEHLLLSKLESLGLLAGGIAHDFNNILTAILGNISLARLDAGRGGQLEDYGLERLEEAEKACQQARSLAGQLLSFAKGSLPIKKATSAANLIKESISLALSGSKASSNVVLPDDLWSVEVDESQISQVFNNLLINADQAMPAGGIITVRAENVVVGDDELPLSGGKYVKITMTDQGIGIPANYLGKIFDPYFSTKQKGSGLGLATVHSIIRNHAGYITVESQVGSGTTFTVYLPAIEKASAPVNGPAIVPIQGHGRILVMDDEKMVRDVMLAMLKRLGYQGVVATNGEEAVDLYISSLQSGQPFSAVIFDLTVPGGMGGKEALRQILERDAEVKAIVSSGYSDDPIMANFQEYGFKGVITKPFRITKLSEVLHDVIFTLI